MGGKSNQLRRRRRRLNLTSSSRAIHPPFDHTLHHLTDFLITETSSREKKAVTTHSSSVPLRNIFFTHQHDMTPKVHGDEQQDVWREGRIFDDVRENNEDLPPDSEVNK